MKKKFLIFLILLTTILVSNPKTVFADEKASGTSAKILFAYSDREEDWRVKTLETYLKDQDSPLAPYAKDFVFYADAYDLDWRFVAAIAGLESTFGKQIPYGTYNAWGWGIFGDNMHYFKSWEDGIATISKGLREKYINEWGASDIYEIGNFYAASPTWAQRVSGIMGRIQDYALRNPKTTLSLSL